MKKQLKLIFILLATITLIACGSGAEDSVVEENLGRSVSASTYATRGVDNTWPPASDGSQEISADLLANNYYLVVDTSGSMNRTGCSGNKPKLTVAKSALKQFVSKLPADANIGLLVFANGRASEVISIGPDRQASVSNAIEALQSGSGGTPLGSAIRVGYESLTTQAQAQLGYGEYHLVVVTDGYADEGNEPDEIVRSMLKGSAVNLHTIGFCIDENHALNLPGLTIYRSASNATALMEGLESVLAESPDFQVVNFEK